MALLVVTSVPPFFGYLTTPQEKWFSGIVYNVHDAAQYLSWMRDARDHLLTENRLTSEPNTPIFFNLHWWLAGRLGSLLGLSLPQSYEAFRLLAVPFLVFSIFISIRLVFQNHHGLYASFFVALLSSGLGWIWILLKQFTGELRFPQDLYLMMANTFYTMLASPHLTLAAALTILVLHLSLQSHNRKSLLGALGAGLLALFLGMGHIYDLVTIWGVLAFFGLLLTLRDGWSWPVFGRLALVMLISAPAVLYWGWVSSDAHPLWKQALAQYDNLGTFTPDPAHLLILLGITFIIALATYEGWVPLQQQSNEQLLFKGWFGVTLVLVYMPLPFRVMLLTGYQLPLSVLATWGLYEHILPWLQERLSGVFWSRFLNQERLAHWLPVVLVVLILPTNLYMLAWRVVDLHRHDYPYYLYQDDRAALRWLETNADPQDVVLSSFTIGHYIPGLAGNRAFLANAVMTMDFDRKSELVKIFFDSPTVESWRQTFVQKNRIRYVFFGPAEREVGKFQLAESVLFKRVFSSPRTEIYEVRPKE